METSKAAALWVFQVVQSSLIVYVAAINVIYFVLMILGFFALRKYNIRLNRSESETLLKSTQLPGISILAPAYNEQLSVRESVHSMLQLRYPEHEVVVINDGSKDETLKLLIEEFHLYKSSRVPLGRIPTKRVKAVYESRDPIRLVVVDKENGGKADSLNAGINYSRLPLFAAVDSDSLLERDALLEIAKPFLESPEDTLATGGIIRVVNGCVVDQGGITEVRAPQSMLARFQAVEYLRAFLGGRVAFSFLNSLLLISGAFGLFRRDAVLAVGGYLTTTVGEDMELVVRLHRWAREQGWKARVVFVPEPVCWTEVPETLKILQRQRNRWQRGAFESIMLHRKMFLNPRFGMLGMFGFPYFTLFELFGPIVELTGYLCTVLGLIFGLIEPRVAALFFLVSVAFGVLLSVSSVVLEELTARKYPAVRDVLILLWAGVIESFGYRQLTSLWRVKGLYDSLRGKQMGWGVMERRGFQKPK